MALDMPLLAYDNLLSTCVVNTRVGAIDNGSSLDRLWDSDLLRPAFFTSSGGVVEIGLYPTSPVNCVIVGASRNDAAGQLVGTTGLEITAYASTVGYGAGGYGAGGYGGYNSFTQVAHVLANTAKSRLLRFDVSATLIVLKFTGCAAKVAIPEIFVGTALEMPALDYNYDPYLETGNTALFQAESGREYARIRYVRLEAKPKWSDVHRDLWAALDAFRERIIETRSPFWYAWMPDTYPDQVYFVRHAGNSAPAPIHLPNRRSFTLNLQEVL